MPIYMDRHDVSKEVTAESVAQLHQEDLKVQHEHNCRGLTYWFDDKRKIAFCLVEAPDAKSVHDMHNHAHGEVPHSIIEVDASLVESFLGRMEDPDSNSRDGLKIIDEPAFRFLLSVQIKIGQLKNIEDIDLQSTIRDYMHEIIQVVNDMHGTVVRHDNLNLLVSLRTPQDAVQCGMALEETLGKKYSHLGLNLGLEAGLPVEGSKSIFEDTIRTSTRLCEIGQGFSVSPQVLKMYQNEQSDNIPHSMEIKNMSEAEMIFLNKLIDFLETDFSDSELRIDTLTSRLGYSRTQASRNFMGLLGLAPNSYLNKYRLEKSLAKLDKGTYSISETAYLCGFSSASYFSKCFHKMYEISPKEYMTAIQD